VFTKKHCVLKLTQLTRTLLDRESVEARNWQTEAQQEAGPLKWEMLKNGKLECAWSFFDFLCVRSSPHPGDLL
jgi:hypothetical protein